jgi:hypothetical protein
MAYIGQGIKQGTFKVLDTSGNTYNGSNTTFSLGTQVGSAAQLLVSHDGVIQKAGTDYTLATGGTQITFSTAPASGASIFITEISGAVGGTVTPSDTSVTADKLNSALLTGHTDIGANIADADLFLTDDGAGGTLRKTAASRLKTYVGAGAGAFDIANLNIDGGTDIGADIADSDLFIIDDGAGGTNRKTAASRIKSYVGGSKLVFIANQEGTNSVGDVSFNDCFSATYKTYFITFQLQNDRDGNNIQFRFQKEDDTTINSDYKYALHTINHSGTENNFVAASGGEVVLTGGTEGGNSGYFGVCNGFMYVHRPFTYDSDLNPCFFNIFSQEVDTGGNFKSIHGGGFLNQTSNNVAGIRFRPGANYMTNRNVTVYGLEQS